MPLNSNIVKPFDPYLFNLPVANIADEINDRLRDNSTIIVTAEPGAGKSTLLPLTILRSLKPGAKILMLEPRRLAARQIAIRMAEMLQENLADTVGYRVRFENHISENTQIEVLTEGILTRKLLTDNELQGVDVVIFDEFHERSLFADVALALCRECQKILRPDLKIVIMSATIDHQKLASSLSAPVITCQGRMFPVKINYAEQCDPLTIPQTTAHIVRQAYNDEKGDILAFLPGESEIRQCEELLKGLDAKIYPLYSLLPQSQQRAAILPDKNHKRKIVLATPIAETSLTIEGVRIVVDSGYCRRMKFDPNTSLSRLELVRISKDMADQRAGRAGRLEPGICYRLWSKATENQMNDHREAEILTADLAPMALDLANFGVNNADDLFWLTPPPRGHFLQARELLLMLQAIDDNGRITEHGKLLSSLPCHPRIAQMLLNAQTQEAKALACDIAAILEERDPLGRDTGVDINLRIEALRRIRRENRNSRNFAKVLKIADQYAKMLKINLLNDAFDPYLTGFLIATAYPERIASAHVGNNAQFLLSNGNLAQISHLDDLAHESWLAVAHLDAREGKGKIFLASPLDPTDLKSLIVERENISWNDKKGGVVAQREMRIGRLVLNSKPLHNVDPEQLKDAVYQALTKNGEQLLDFNKDVEQLQNRILSLRTWNEDNNFPDVRTEKLLEDPKSWLDPYLGSATTVEELKKIDLSKAIFYSLPFDVQQKLNNLAPTHIVVPSGSKIRLEYQANASEPVLSVRLQEVFGLIDTPTVNDGKQKVLMHLLSPGFKLVQITQDLSSFWKEAYFEVAKELKSRYPKHVWPADPLTEPPTRRTKNHK